MKVICLLLALKFNSHHFLMGTKLGVLINFA